MLRLRRLLTHYSHERQRALTTSRGSRRTARSWDRTRKRVSGGRLADVTPPPVCRGGQSPTPLYGGVARTPHTSPTLAKRRSHHLDTPPTVKVPGTPPEPVRGFKEEEEQQVSRRAVYLDEREIESTRRVFQFVVEDIRDKLVTPKWPT